MVLPFPSTLPRSSATSSMTLWPDSSFRMSHQLANKLQRLVLLDVEAAERLESIVDKMLDYQALHARWAAERAE